MKTTDYHAVVSIGALKPKGPGSNPFLDGVCVKFASSSCSFIDSLQVLWCPPTVQRLTG